MSLTADDILQHRGLEACVRGQARSLLLIHDAIPRIESLFVTRQLWLIANAALAQYFPDAAAGGVVSG